MQLKQDFFTQLPDFYSQVMPQGLSEPKWLGWSRDAARLVGLSEPTDELLAQLSGNQHIDGAHYYSQVYSGHQFGGYSPHLCCDKAGYRAWFLQVVKDTAKMIAHWQAVGFAHGVMNTDNMSILGDSFDFGPFAFLDTFQEDFICNHSDPQGRYAFNQQPGVGLWNLQRLAQALSPLMSSDDLIVALNTYQNELIQHYLLLMRNKLGITLADSSKDTQEQDNNDLALISELM